jgi:hypothetical protein
MENFVKKPVLLVIVVIMLMGLAGCSAASPAKMPVVLLTDFGSADYNVLPIRMSG